MSTTSLRALLEAGVHYGHLTRYWEPSMAPYIFGSRNKIHIINLEKTLEYMAHIRDLMREAGRKNNTILFVGTKRGIKQAVQKGAESIEQPFVCKRWLGGTLTNYKTIRMSIKRLEDLEYARDSDATNILTKKEALLRDREIERLQLNIGGIRKMNGLPDALFIVDIKYESIAVAEARKLGIPIIAVVDTNVKPELVDHIIPGNDDSVKAVELYMQLMTSSYGEGQDLYEQSLKEQCKEQSKPMAESAVADTCDAPEKVATVDPASDQIYEVVQEPTATAAVDDKESKNDAPDNASQTT